MNLNRNALVDFALVEFSFNYWNCFELFKCTIRAEYLTSDFFTFI